MNDAIQAGLPVSRYETFEFPSTGNMGPRDLGSGDGEWHAAESFLRDGAVWSAGGACGGRAGRASREGAYAGSLLLSMSELTLPTLPSNHSDLNHHPSTLTFLSHPPPPLLSLDDLHQQRNH